MSGIIGNSFRTLKWFVRQILFEDFVNYIKREHKDRPAVILANGPSLNDSLSLFLSSSDKYDFCVVNDFCQSNFFSVIRPIYYVLADPMYFNNSWQKETEKKTIKILTEVTWNMKLYIPFNVCKTNVVSALRMNDKIDLIPYHTNEYNGMEFFRFFLFRKGLSMPKIQNVVIPCIFNLINIGYKQIYLYGVDHSWTKDIVVNKRNQVCLVNKHFYQEDSVATPWLKTNGDPYKMYEILRDLSYMFEGYHLLKEYAHKSNCRICNMTQNSFIDAFDRSISMG